MPADGLKAEKNVRMLRDGNSARTRRTVATRRTLESLPRRPASCPSRKWVVHGVTTRAAGGTSATEHTFSLFRLSRLQGVGPGLQISEAGATVPNMRLHTDNGGRVKVRNIVDLGSRLDLQIGGRVQDVQDGTLKLSGQKAGR